jgi:hypothetical protein
MERRGRRGSRAPIEAAAPDREPISEPTDAAPELLSPPASESVAQPAAEDPDVPDRDSLTALAIAEEALARVSETPPEPPGKAAAPRAADELCALGRAALAAFAESQAVLARGFADLGAEITALTQSELAAAARTATRLLAVRTLSDAMMLQTDYIRTRLDAAATGSARLSNLGVKLATEAAEPLVTQFGRNWLQAVRLTG